MNFDGNFVSLVREMAAAARHLDELPSDTHWSQDDLSTLDDVRHAALNLAQMAEATIQESEAGNG